MCLPEITHHKHPRRSVYVPGGVYFITTVVGDRADYFEEVKLQFIFLKSLGQGAVLKDFEILALALMPDHLHLILRMMRFSNSKIMHSLKKHVSREINKTLDIDIFRWQHSFRDYLMRDERDFERYFFYTVFNSEKHDVNGFTWSVACKPDETLLSPKNNDWRREMKKLTEDIIALRKNKRANEDAIKTADAKIDRPGLRPLRPDRGRG